MSSYILKNKLLLRIWILKGTINRQHDRSKKGSRGEACPSVKGRKSSGEYHPKHHFAAFPTEGMELLKQENKEQAEDCSHYLK